MTNFKSIGIIGGMGPAATCDLMRKIIERTDANDDQHHIHTYVDCNVNIPDRTEAILHHGESPVPEIVKSGKKLQEMGADVLVMPCHTGHYFFDEIVSHFSIPMLDITKETAEFLKKNNIKKAGILATDGTLKSNIYKKTLELYGIEAVYPEENEQKLFMRLIYDHVKCGKLKKDELPEQEIRKSLHSLSKKGAEIFVLACTELPIVFEILDITENTIDPTLLLAEAAIRFSGGKVRREK